MKDQRNGKFSLSLYSERNFLFVTLNPSTPKRDQDIIFPYNTNTISSRQVMRKEEILNMGISRESNTKFSKPSS